MRRTRPIRIEDAAWDYRQSEYNAKPNANSDTASIANASHDSESIVYITPSRRRCFVKQKKLFVESYLLCGALLLLAPHLCLPKPSVLWLRFA